jgi:hypothetical protein
LYDYIAQAPNQISLRRGEIIRVTQRGPSGGWSSAINSAGCLIITFIYNKRNIFNRSYYILKEMVDSILRILLRF